MPLIIKIQKQGNQANRSKHAYFQSQKYLSSTFVFIKVWLIKTSDLIGCFHPSPAHYHSKSSFLWVSTGFRFKQLCVCNIMALTAASKSYYYLQTAKVHISCRNAQILTHPRSDLKYQAVLTSMNFLLIIIPLLFQCIRKLYMLRCYNLLFILYTQKWKHYNIR